MAGDEENPASSSETDKEGEVNGGEHGTQIVRQTQAFPLNGHSFGPQAIGQPGRVQPLYTVTTTPGKSIAEVFSPMFAPKDFDFTNPESEVRSSSIIPGNDKNKRKNDTTSGESDQANKKRKGPDNEERILDHESQISIKDSQIKDLQDTMKDKYSAIRELEGQKKALEAGVKDLDGQIKDLQETIKGKDSAIQELEGKEKTLEAEVKTLYGQIKDLQETIKDKVRAIRDLESKEKAPGARVNNLRNPNLDTRVAIIVRLNRLAEHFLNTEEKKAFGFDTCVKAENVDEETLKYVLSAIEKTKIAYSGPGSFFDPPSITSFFAPIVKKPLFVQPEHCLRCNKPKEGHDRRECVCFCGRHARAHENGKICPEACFCAGNTWHSMSEHWVACQHRHPTGKIPHVAAVCDLCHNCGAKHPTYTCPNLIDSYRSDGCICGGIHFFGNCPKVCVNAGCNSTACREHCFHCGRIVKHHNSTDCDYNNHTLEPRFRCRQCKSRYDLNQPCACSDASGVCYDPSGAEKK